MPVGALAINASDLSLFPSHRARELINGLGVSPLRQPLDSQLIAIRAGPISEIQLP